MKAKGTPWVIHTGGGAAGGAARLRTPVYVINLKNPQRLGSREVLVVMEQRQRRHGGRGSHHVLLNSSVNSSQRSVPHKVFGSLHRALLSLARSCGVGSTKHAWPQVTSSLSGVELLARLQLEKLFRKTISNCFWRQSNSARVLR